MSSKAALMAMERLPWRPKKGKMKGSTTYCKVQRMATKTIEPPTMRSPRFTSGLVGVVEVELTVDFVEVYWFICHVPIHLFAKIRPYLFNKG
jgi:hypothetical protein